MVHPARFSRQSDLVKCNMRTPICVVGAGGIGSFVVLTLAKMGFTDITVFDYDTVEEHNLPNQFYREEDIGQLKVVALARIVEAFTGVQILPVPSQWTADHEDFIAPRVLIAAVDSMSVRKELFDAYVAHEMGYFLDGRMGADQVEVYSIAGSQGCAAYEATLWKDSETSPLPCTSKATIYVVLQIASVMASNLRLMLSDQPFRAKVLVDMFNIKMY